MASTNKEFYGELVDFYPPPEPPESLDNPPESGPEFERELGWLGTHIDPFHATPLIVMQTYRSMLLAERAVHDLSPQQIEERNIRIEGTNYVGPSEQDIADARLPYERHIAALPQQLPREGTALLAGFAVNEFWGNRLLAARVLPTIVEIAPEVTGMLLERLSQDYQSGAVRAQATESLQAIGTVPKRQEPPELPYWRQPGWPGVFVWTSGADLESFLHDQGFSLRRIAGAARTATARFAHPNSRAYRDWARVAPFPERVQVQFPDDKLVNGRYAFDMHALRARIAVTAMNERSWEPFAVPIVPGPKEDVLTLCKRTIRQNLSALSLYLNHRLPHLEPLPIPIAEPMDEKAIQD